MKIVKYILLFIPIFWYIGLWGSFFFDIHLITWNNPPALVDDLIGPILLIIGAPLSFIFGIIYTAYNKLWLWFLGYMILGGLPLILFFLGAIIG